MIRMSPAISNPTSLEEADRAEQLSRLTGALRTLADDERLAIHLHYLEDDAPQAAASALGLSRSGYYKLLVRARRRLASLLREVRKP